MTRMLVRGLGHRRIRDAWAEGCRRSREPSDGRIGIRRMIGRHLRRRWRTADEKREQYGSHYELPMAHVPDARCWACMRSSLWSFATSAPFATNKTLAPPSMSLTFAFECTPIIPPA
jgi:hypothetical protein